MSASATEPLLVSASPDAEAPWLAGGDPVLGIAQHHGLSLTPREARALGAPAPEDTLSALHALRVLGFGVQVLGGDYLDLLELRPPFLAQMASGGLRAIHGVDAQGVTLRDGATGARTVLPRAAFEADWTGDVLSATPVAIDAVAARVRRARSLTHRLLSPLGLSPLRAGGVAAALAGVVALVAAALTGQVSAWGLAICLALALNATVTSCPRCDRAGVLVGSLPLAPLGAAAYAALLAAQLLGAHSAVVAVGLGAAAGLHLLLLGLLLRERLFCARCVLVACAALGTTATVLPAAPLGVVLAALASAGAGLGLVVLARRLRRLRIDAATLQVTRRILAEDAPPAPGTLSLTVLSRADCVTCSFFEAAVRPGLEASWGERLRVEVREAGEALVSTPFLVLRGANAVVMPGFDVEHGYDRLERALETLAGAAEADGAITVLPP